MSTPGITSANPNIYQSTTPQHGFRYYVQQLGQALQSGDLSTAQQAYASLSQLPQFQNVQNGNDTATSSTSSSQFTSIVQTLTQIGNDLQSGDLSDAQQAFSSLQQKWQGSAQANTADTTGQTQGIGGHHHHHHSGGGDASTSASSTSSTNGTSGSGSIEDQILAMLTNIDNTLTGIQSDLTDGSSSSAITGITGAGSTSNAATITPPVNVLT